MEGSFCLIGEADNGRWTIYILVAGLKVVHAVNIRWNALTFVYEHKAAPKNHAHVSRPLHIQNSLSS